MNKAKTVTWTYPMPDSRAFPWEMAEVTAQPNRTVTVRLDLIDVEKDLVSMVVSHQKAHASKPAALLLGWKAFLVLCAQRQDFGEQDVMGVPVMVHPLIHPMGRSALAPRCSTAGLLEYLAAEGLTE